MQTRITYIANMGFILSNEKSKIIIDALFEPVISEYPAPSKQCIEAILSDTKADRDTIMIVTHNHADHYNPMLTQKFLSADPQSKLVCSEQVKKELSMLSEFDNYERQIITLNGKMRADFEFNNSSIQIMKTDHCGPPGDPVTDVENLCCLLSFNGVNILHPGDCHQDSEFIESLNLTDSNIDVALLPIWMFDPDGLEIIKNFIKPKKVAITHVPKEALSDIKSSLAELTEYESSIIGKPFVPEGEGDYIQVGNGV